jgi:DNA gyrase subunit B
VDGSHIRTLLLTLFYRQMPELVEHGHLYIAQPPLFKVKRGKKELYLKNETELDEFVVQSAIEGKRLGGVEGALIEGETLRDAAQAAVQYAHLFGMLSQRLDPAVVDALVHCHGLTASVLQSTGDDSRPDELDQQLDCLRAHIAAAEPDLSFAIERPAGTNGEPRRLSCETQRDGLPRRKVIDAALMRSPELAELRAIAKRLAVLGRAPFRLMGPDSEVVQVPELAALGALVDRMGRKGLQIQRYKGLGEMNPDQLWETTMDPDTRTLLRVRIDDTVEADGVFTVLMGDQVEPRRDFIATNALAAKHLDI